MVKTKKQVDLLTMFVLSEDAQERAALAEKLRKMLSKEEAPKVTIASVLRELGAPTNVLGYKYLIRAIEMQMQSNEPLGFIKGCYMGIAKECGTTGSRVERAIRHCVGCIWDRGDYDALKRYFGNSINPNRGKPTNSQFITRIAEAVQEGRDA